MEENLLFDVETNAEEIDAAQNLPEQLDPVAAPAQPLPAETIELPDTFGQADAVQPVITAPPSGANPPQLNVTQPIIAAQPAIVTQPGNVAQSGTVPPAPDTSQAPDDAEFARMRREVEEFAKAYPGVTELPDSVLNDIAQNGCTPIEAYQRHVIAEQAAQIQALKKMTTPGSVQTQGSVSHDEFLNNFN